MSTNTADKPIDFRSDLLPGAGVVVVVVTFPVLLLGPISGLGGISSFPLQPSLLQLVTHARVSEWF